jgi:hypothetical protein
MQITNITKTAQTKTAQAKGIDKDELIMIVDAIRLYLMQNRDDIPKKLQEQIKNLPSKQFIKDRFSVCETELLYDTAREMWKKLCGQDLKKVDFDDVKKDIEILDGNYWMLPGEFLLSGFNHFSIAKKHKGMFCSLLGINSLIFERLVCEQPMKLIEHIIDHGGIRVNIDKSKNRVICQTNEASWPWTRNKLIKMYHEHKVAKVIDSSTPYRGWKSGINIVIK